jgi:hypothetical protein
MIRLILLILFMANAAFTSAEISRSPDITNKNFIGYAYDIKTNNLLYTEHHTYQTAYIHQVNYREADGELFATKKINYQKSYYAPDISQENKRNGEKISSKRNGDNISIRYQENSKSQLKQDSIDFSPKLIIDAGFDHFITQNWQALNSGKKTTIDYLIPSSLDPYELSIKKEVCKNENRYCFSISASNFFISLFSSELLLTYSTDASKSIGTDSNKEVIKLESFQGRSNICDSEGNYQDVKITYKYAES